MNVKELLKKCQRDRTAVLATNFYNFETLTAVMQAAQRMQAPVLLQLTRSSICCQLLPTLPIPMIAIIVIGVIQPALSFLKMELIN